MSFPTILYVRPAKAQTSLPIRWSLEYPKNINLLTEHHLEFLHLKGDCTGLSESIHVNLTHCWKSCVTAHFNFNRGEICYRSYILGRYVNKWKSSLAKLRLQKAVKALQRKHLLRKGMNAFKWSINRSQLRQGILQDRVNAILLSLNFNKVIVAMETKLSDEKNV